MPKEIRELWDLVGGQVLWGCEQEQGYWQGWWQLHVQLCEH